MADNQGHTSNLSDYDRSKGGQQARTTGGDDTPTGSGGSSMKQGDSGSVGKAHTSSQQSNR